MGRMVPNSPWHVETKLEIRMKKIGVIIDVTCFVVGVGLCIGWGLIMPEFLAQVFGFELPK